MKYVKQFWFLFDILCGDWYVMEVLLELWIFFFHQWGIGLSTIIRMGWGVLLLYLQINQGWRFTLTENKHTEYGQWKLKTSLVVNAYHLLFLADLVLLFNRISFSYSHYCTGTNLQLRPMWEVFNSDANGINLVWTLFAACPSISS